jgi:CheY-like chemotaxis protein
VIEIENTQPKSNQLNFWSALVIQEADDVRRSVMELLRKRGWLAHGVSRAKQAFDILPHIPYDLIVLDAELPDISGMDFIRVLHTSRQWRAIRLVVITNSNSLSLMNQAGECGAFLARKSRWEDDLLGFLSLHSEDSQVSNTYSPEVLPAVLSPGPLDNHFKRSKRVSSADVTRVSAWNRLARFAARLSR